MKPHETEQSEDEDGDGKEKDQKEQVQKQLAKRQRVKIVLGEMREIIANLVVLPMLMYTSMGRLISTKGVKTNYVNALIGQELLLHNLPLTLLIIYNNRQLDKMYTLDSFCLTMSFLHLAQIVTELTYARVQLNKGFNLE